MNTLLFFFAYIYIYTVNALFRHIYIYNVSQANHAKSLLPGILEMKKPKLKRKIVRRVILGPRNLFNPEVLKDELDATGLELWGLVWHESWPVDLQLFAAGVGIADHMDGLYVGKLSRNAPADLSEGNQWLSSKFLDFGAIEARGERKTHTCMYIYIYIHMTISGFHFQSFCSMGTVHMR